MQRLEERWERASRAQLSLLMPGECPSLNLPAEGASFREAGQAARGLAKHHVAVPAQHHRLRVAVHGGDLKAPGALDVHEEAVRRLDHPLQLALLLLGIRVQEVDIHGFLVAPRASAPSLAKIA